MSSFPFFSAGLNDYPNQPTVQDWMCGASQMYGNIGAERLKQSFGTYTSHYPFRQLTPAQMEMFPKWPTKSISAFANCPGRSDLGQF